MLQPDVPLTACLPVSPLDFSPVVVPSVECPHLEDQSKPIRTSLFQAFSIETIQELEQARFPIGGRAT